MASHLTGAPAVVACDVLDDLPHSFSVAGVEASLQSLLMSHVCFLDACLHFYSSSDMYVCIHVT